MSEIFIGLGANGERQVLRLDQANRHGLIAGATGTGKTSSTSILPRWLNRLNSEEAIPEPYGT